MKVRELIDQLSKFDPEATVILQKNAAVVDGVITRLHEKTFSHDKNASDIRLHRFNEFWKAYPRKKSKGQAFKAWNKLKPDDQIYAAILTAIENAKNSYDWKKDGGTFIPYPATWLNAMGWEDELTLPPKSSRDVFRERLTKNPSHGLQNGAIDVEYELI